MSLPVMIAVTCCLGLLGLGSLLGAAVHRFTRKHMVAAYLPGSSAAMAGVPMAFFLHPRMDLAAGRAPLHQAVNLDQQRSRHELSHSCQQSAAMSVESPAAFEPFEQRRKHSRSVRRRLDLVYARDTMGDLSDPVCRKRQAA